MKIIYLLRYFIACFMRKANQNFVSCKIKLFLLDVLKRKLPVFNLIAHAAFGSSNSVLICTGCSKPSGAGFCSI